MKQKTRNQRYLELTSLADKELNASVIESAKIYLHDFPHSKGAWSMYSHSLFQLSKLNEAKKALLKTIDLRSDSDEHLGWLLCRMGRIYEDSGNFRKAIEWFKKAHDEIPQEATFLIYIGVTFLRIGKYNEAVEALTNATLCKEGFIDEAFYNLGVVRMAQGNYEEAFLCLKKALKIDPKYEEAKQALKDVKKVFEIKNKQH